ncbi:hypothetical protein PC123_g6350 [Phytophthora cactorum]|nr:hypothetical protein PC123_g6350 [Phytophthora cactorum]
MCVARFSILLFKNLTNTLDADTASILPELLKEAHDGVENADPFAQPKQNYFYHLDERSHFFDHHMCTNRRRITEIEDELPVHCFAMTHNRRKEASSWPPTYPSDETFYLAPIRSSSLRVRRAR